MINHGTRTTTKADQRLCTFDPESQKSPVFNRCVEGGAENTSLSWS